MLQDKFQPATPWDEFGPEHDQVIADMKASLDAKHALDPKAALMSQIVGELGSRNLNQTQIGQLLGVTRTRANNLMTGKASMFSLDALVVFAQRLNWRVKLTMETSTHEQHDAELAAA